MVLFAEAVSGHRCVLSAPAALCRHGWIQQCAGAQCWVSGHKSCWCHDWCLTETPKWVRCVLTAHETSAARWQVSPGQGLWCSVPEGDGAKYPLGAPCCRKHHRTYVCCRKVHPYGNLDDDGVEWPQCSKLCLAFSMVKSCWVLLSPAWTNCVQ